MKTVSLAQIARTLLLCCLIAVTPSPADEKLGVTLITHESRALSELSRAQLYALFSMRTPAWPDGTKVRIVVLPDDHALHIEFCRQVLRTFPYVLRQTWDQRLFSGRGSAPLVVNSVEEMRARVAATEGAIGYVPEPVDNDQASLISGLIHRIARRW